MDPVKTQYEAYPYPPRDPADEKTRLITGSPSRVPEVDHYLFAGARDWSQPFRALVAGGGTGDGLVQLAQGLADAHCPAEIHYLDLSTAARAIAEARIAARGLTQVRFHTGSLLEAAPLGPFDYIDCCGVLHHLPDPEAGLRALRGALAPGGGMGLMVYGRYGRTGVYEIQEALRVLAPPGETDLPDRVAAARKLLKTLPPTNRLRRNPFLGDHEGDDAALYDLLLHERDRAYGVPEVLALVEGAGLEVVGFLEPLRYEPDFYLQEPGLRARAGELPQAARWELAEALAGNLHKHVFYVTEAGRAEAALARPGPAAIPVLEGLEAPALAKAIGAGKPLKGRLEGLAVEIPLPRAAAAAIGAIDGRKSFADLATGKDWEPFWAGFEPVYRVLNGLGMLHLRAERPI